MLLPLGRFPVEWLLSLLQLLRLLLMFLLQLLSLLLVLLLHLLFLRVIRLLFIQVQVLLILLLLEFVSFLSLLRNLLVLLLLVFLVQLRVARILGCSAPRAGGREDGLPYWLEQRCSLSFLDFLRDWLEYMALLPLCADTVPRSIKISGPGCSRDTWLAHVR